MSLVRDQARRIGPTSARNKGQHRLNHKVISIVDLTSCWEASRISQRGGLPQIMRRQLIDHFIHQTQIAGHISGRDVAKRSATTLLMVCVCIAAGFIAEGLIIGAVIIALEMIAFPLNKRASQFENPIGARRAIWVFFVNWAAMLPFLSFAVTLSYSDSLPFVLAGYLWVFGVFCPCQQYIWAAAFFLTGAR